MVRFFIRIFKGDHNIHVRLNGSPPIIILILNAQKRLFTLTNRKKNVPAHGAQH